MLCNYLDVASITMPTKIPIKTTGIKLVIIEMPKVAKRDLLIWRLNNVNHTQNVKTEKAINVNITIVNHTILFTVELRLKPSTTKNGTDTNISRNTNILIP